MPLIMKALIMISAIAKSSSLGRRGAAFVAPIHRAASTLLPSQLVAGNASTKRKRFCTTALNHLRLPINFERYCTTVLFNHFSTDNCEVASPTAATATNELNPFTWSDITDLFTDPNDSNHKSHNYIPSDHPNLALFRRSTSEQVLYEEHKNYLTNNWISPYDYLVYSKFGEEFGFEKELIQAVDDPSQEKVTWDSDSDGPSLVAAPKGFRYQCNPSLSQASDYTIQNGMTYLKLVLNDFPYDVEEGIHHWCLWKIGGACRTEGILKGELQWALHELNSYPSDGIDCSSSLIVNQNELTGSDVSAIDKFSTFYWVNPPHLQSMPEIHHAHILCKPILKENGFSSPPPV
ncbi:N-acetylglucosamine-induced protein 1 family protein [Skeletonema marinoi]|uniref:N-acetylglucosamine-induced protein 1 family protein n=1 Tax=Skeletonema marinoi TaxID=267567 RepID=A0AAD9D8R9_9STRA|nr:N-acetylglucosamine-induced protein 1 family protein [Skeletonema marinoi]